MPVWLCTTRTDAGLTVHDIHRCRPGCAVPFVCRVGPRTSLLFYVSSTFSCPSSGGFEGQPKP
eukprot:scaffold156929_cov23-Tisochrysis_lutea.AAC.2